MIRNLADDLYQVKLGSNSSNCYLITGDITILIDTGTVLRIPEMANTLSEIGYSTPDIDLVINTHEHSDHIGGNVLFQKTALIAAHRNAAVKIISGDDEVMHCRAHAQKFEGYHVHAWLSNTDVIDADSWFLKVLHTPGHTSGCISLYDPRRRVLFSGDALFASGTLSTIYESGSLGEYFNSLRRLGTMKIDLLFPGHGRESNNVDGDLELTIRNAIAQFPGAARLAAMFVPVIAGLCLFETISSIDNAIINAEVLATMDRWAQRWFLIWGLLIAVAGIRFLLPWVIVWATVPELGPIEAITATFSDDPAVIEAIERSAPVLLMFGGTFLVFLFFHWLFLEDKHYGLRGERYIRTRGVWFFAVVSILLSPIVTFMIVGYFLALSVRSPPGGGSRA